MSWSPGRLQVGYLSIYKEGYCSTWPLGQILRHVQKILKEKACQRASSRSGGRNEKQESVPALNQGQYHQDGRLRSRGSRVVGVPDSMSELEPRVPHSPRWGLCISLTEQN